MWGIKGVTLKYLIIFILFILLSSSSVYATEYCRVAEFTGLEDTIHISECGSSKLIFTKCVNVEFKVFQHPIYNQEGEKTYTGRTNFTVEAKGGNTVIFKIDKNYALNKPYKPLLHCFVKDNPTPKKIESIELKIEEVEVVIAEPSPPEEEKEEKEEEEIVKVEEPKDKIEDALTIVQLVYYFIGSIVTILVGVFTWLQIKKILKSKQKKKKSNFIQTIKKKIKNYYKKFK